MNRILLLIGIVIGLLMNWFATELYLERGDHDFAVMFLIMISAALAVFCLTSLFIHRNRP